MDNSRPLARRRSLYAQACFAAAWVGVVLPVAAQTGSEPPPPYGPMLTRRPPDQATQDAPVRDDAKKRPAPRRRALQGPEPLAPRPLRPAEEAKPATVFVPPAAPPPVTPPQPVVPSSTITGACPGGVCRDAAGTTLSTGGGAVGVNSGGRVCVRGTATMQCF